LPELEWARAIAPTLITAAINADERRRLYSPGADGICLLTSRCENSSSRSESAREEKPRWLSAQQAKARATDARRCCGGAVPRAGCV